MGAIALAGIDDRHDSRPYGSTGLMLSQQPGL